MMKKEEGVKSVKKINWKVIVLLFSILMIGFYIVKFRGEPTNSELIDNSEIEFEFQEEPDIIKKDITEALTVEELYDYLTSYSFLESNYKDTLLDKLASEAYHLFPNENGMSFRIIKKEGTHFIGKVIMGTGSTFQFMVLPNFYIQVLEETLTKGDRSDYYIHPAGKEYVLNGCRIEEYEMLSAEKEGREIKAVFPLLSMKENKKWEGLNTAIWEGIIHWYEEELEHIDGRISLDYEIKTLDDSLISILFMGKYGNNNDKNEIAMGITLSMSSENLISYEVFTGGQEDENYFDFYIEDRKLVKIDNIERGYRTEEIDLVDFVPYRIEKSEREVYDKYGLVVGTLTYEMIIPETLKTAYSSNSYEIIRKRQMEEKGRFFQELAPIFEEMNLKYMDSIARESEKYRLKELLKFECKIKNELFFNNNDQIGIHYSYHWNIVGKPIEGTGKIMYDMKTGEMLDYEDWQEELMERIIERGWFNLNAN